MQQAPPLPFALVKTDVCGTKKIRFKPGEKTMSRDEKTEEW